MRYLGKVLLLVALLAAVVGSLLFLTEEPRSVLADTRNSVLNSRGWRFAERINCSDAYALVTGNVSLDEHKLLTSVAIFPKHGTPQAYLFYADRNASLVNIEGTWVRRGGGWRVEDTILVRLIDMALSAEEKVLRRSGAEARVLFNGTCSPLCSTVFNDISSLAGSRAVAPSYYSGVIILVDRTPSRIIIVFKGAKSSCSVDYTVFDFNKSILVETPLGG